MNELTYVSKEDYLKHTIYFMAYSLGDYEEFVFQHNYEHIICYGIKCCFEF